MDDGGTPIPPPFAFVAKVRYPLFSLTASGNLAGAVNYTSFPRCRRKAIPRQRGDKLFVAEYPPDVLSGWGVVRKALPRRRDLKRGRLAADTRKNRDQRAKAARFTIARTLALWAVKYGVTASRLPPAELVPVPPPWWDGLYFQRAVRREQLHFPGQARGETVGFVTRIRGTTTPTGFIMRQLLGRKFARLEITRLAWNNLSPSARENWTPRGDTPWDVLPTEFDFGDGVVFDRRFVNCWMQASQLIAAFELDAGWLERGADFQLHCSPFVRAPDDPVVVAWETHLSAGARVSAMESKPWRRRDG